jgi:hypothetical protein
VGSTEERSDELASRASNPSLSAQGKS